MGDKGEERLEEDALGNWLQQLGGWQYHSLIREHWRRKISGEEGHGFSLRLAGF